MQVGETVGPSPAAREPRRAALLGIRAWTGDWGGRTVVTLGAYTVVYLLWQIFKWGGPEHRTLISDAAFLPISIAGAVLAWRAARSRELDARTRRAWVILGAAFLAYWIGDVLFTIFENTMAEVPFPSWADAAYLAFYPLTLWGVLAFPTARRSAADRAKTWLDSGTVVVGGYMVLWFFVLGRTAQQTDTGPLEKIFSIAYPVADLVLIFAITALLLRRPLRSSANALGVLASGLVLFVIADVAFGNLELSGRYQGGDWPDTLWIVAQFLMVVAAHVQHYQAAHLEVVETGEDSGARPFSSLPYIVVFGSFLLLVFVARHEAAYPVGGMLLGAVGITALVVTRQIAALRENTKLVAELHALATTDSLTGLRSRRHFFELAEREFYRARRYERPLTAMMMDIDFFKRINDTHGHAVGDEVLEEIAYRCRVSLRHSDIVGRYGGDELVILLPDTTLDSAVETAARILSTVDGAPVDSAAGPIPVSISVGIASAEGCADLGELLSLADEALYQAKQAGRNCTRALSA